MNDAEFEDEVKGLLTSFPLALAALQGLGIDLGQFFAGDAAEFVAELGKASEDSTKPKPVR